MISINSLPPSIPATHAAKGVTELGTQGFAPSDMIHQVTSHHDVGHPEAGRSVSDPALLAEGKADIAPAQITKPSIAAHNPVLWPAQIDPVEVHTAVLIAQEAYRNQKALEGLAMLVQVAASGNSALIPGDKTVPRGQVRPAPGTDAARDDGARR